MDRYAVMGNPIKHSKSPQIHQLFAKATGQTLSYETILVEKNDFPAAVTRFFQAGGKGLNITLPFKEEAWHLAECRTERAELAGAVNTLSFKDGSIHGDNTDGAGLVTDILNNCHGQLRDKRILVVGAGGAVRGVLLPLLKEQPSALHLVNRTASKAALLAEHFQSYGTLRGGGFESLDNHAYDWIINGSSASLTGDVPPLPDTVINHQTWCYDLMYGAETTPFNAWAQQHGAANVFDGLGMLVEQAAEAFYLWRGLRPQTADVIAQLRAAFKK